jgi:hypothetical protein
MSRCMPGELAVVIEATNQANIGPIVKVVAQHDGTGPLGGIGPRPVWLVHAPMPTTWTDGPKRYRRKNGPVPDSQLQPIRGSRQTEAANRSRSHFNNTAADSFTIE